MFQPSNSNKSFIFNININYNLKNIKQPPIQQFINNIINTSNHPKFTQYHNTLNKLLQNNTFLTHHKLQKKHKNLQTLPTHIPTNIIQNITLSTIHNCPPHKIKTIYHYILKKKELNTFIKLNPTLLKYTHIHKILNIYNFNYINLKKKSFNHNLKLTQTLKILKHLITLTKKKSLNFNVKLTNTLNTINNKNTLPNKKIYISNHTLFPLSINITTILSHTFNNKLPISYSNNTNQLTIHNIFNTNIHPITITTNLLKPNNYLHLNTYIHKLKNSNT